MSPKGSMTAKQQRFADAILAGNGPSAADRLAGYAPTSNRLVTIRAQRTLKSPAVAAYIAAGRAETRRKSILTREEALTILAKIARERDASRRDKISAIERAAKMQGYDMPSQVEIKVEGSLLHQIRTG